MPPNSCTASIATSVAACEQYHLIADASGSEIDVPVSAASISQVHFAVTMPDAAHPEGRDVAVKVLRPDIELAFARDIDLLLWIAEVIERTQPKLRRLKPVEVVKTFAATVRVEMDLRLEAASASELRGNFEGDPTYRVPEIDWSRTARRVMTQQRLSGIPFDDGPAMRAAGLDVDDPGQAPIGSADVADHPDVVADHDAAAAKRPSLHGRHGALAVGVVDKQGVATAVERDDPAGDGVVVGGSLLRTRSATAFRTVEPLVVVDVVAGGHRTSRSHASANPG